LGYNKINKEEKIMEKIKQIWTLAQAHPKVAVAAVVVVVAIYFLVT
tara:strand:+ start:460 stop:597 length:138 start_codon:yes stop_codon:yes gene_type:complete